MTLNWTQPITTSFSAHWSSSMTEPTLYSFSFCLEDCRRIVQALRNEAYQVKQESDRACEKGARDYGTLLWEENTILNSIAETIDWRLPEI
jgi:hypothetical protein